MNVTPVWFTPVRTRLLSRSCGTVTPVRAAARAAVRVVVGDRRRVRLDR